MAATIGLVPQQFASYDLFGAKITPTTISDLLVLFQSHIDARQSCIVASQNMHGLRVARTDATLRELHELPQTHVHIDGMALVALCRLRGIPATKEHRVTLVDFVWPLLELAEQRGWRVYYVGASDEVLRAGTARIKQRLPALLLQSHHGFLSDETEKAKVAHVIEGYSPHLVLVGMGMGIQERWILDNRASIGTASVMTMGACMEYVAGVVGTPPRWMGQAGFEWLYRLLENPGRFWRRYLIEPWFVFAHVASYLVFRK